MGEQKLRGTLAVAVIFILCLQFFSTFAAKAAAQQASPGWSMFRANPSHSGTGTGNPVLIPTLLWNYTFTNGLLVDSSSAVVNGIVYVDSNDKNIYALNAITGTQLWNYTIDGGISSPAVVGEVVYIGSWDNVYALKATDSAKLWDFTLLNGTGADVESSPTVVGDVVYIGADEGGVYALNATSGAQIWHYIIDNDDNVLVESSPAVVNRHSLFRCR